MSQHFTATGYLAEGVLKTPTGKTVAFASLPPFLRVLLTTDGTVTKSLESYFWEPIVVENLAQSRVILTEDAPLIGKQHGDAVLERRVKLVGRLSGRMFATADSIICSDQLPAGLGVKLETGQMGIGELLRECGLETYRELIDYGALEKEGEQDAAMPRLDSLWRCYRIVVHGCPLIQITEHFPMASYRAGQ